MGKKRKHRTAYQRACDAIETEGRKQCMILYSATALALYLYWDKKKQTIISLFDITGEVWQSCASTNEKSMLCMCEEETGIEVQIGNEKSWHDLPYLNGTFPAKPMSNAQWAYMRQQQTKWFAAQVMACLMVALHRKYGFGFDRLSRIYSQIDEIRTEYSLDGDRLRAVCLKEVGIDVHDAYTQPREEKEVV